MKQSFCAEKPSSSFGAFNSNLRQLLAAIVTTKMMLIGCTMLSVNENALDWSLAGQMCRFLVFLESRKNEYKCQAL